MLPPPAGAMLVLEHSMSLLSESTPVAGAAALESTVALVMTRTVTTCRAEDDLEHLGQLMTAQRIRHVPVVDDGGSMIGIVSIGDVVKQRLGHLENENQALFDYFTNSR